MSRYAVMGYEEDIYTSGWLVYDTEKGYIEGEIVSFPRQTQRNKEQAINLADQLNSLK